MKINFPYFLFAILIEKKYKNVGLETFVLIKSAQSIGNAFSLTILVILLTNL